MEKVSAIFWKRWIITWYK